MPKIIVVKSCDGCPWKADFGYKLECGNPSGPADLTQEEAIHPDCPLQDLTKESEASHEQ